ncbi:hypothetical protein [Bacillus toyonensis]|uniref:hypothetical protein n=1 Tax=Bacillus toyonensis TaxID=155322 RepID=UPI002E1A761D|nr:hypothetical protein [Bacillus toyonensis]
MKIRTIILISIAAIICLLLVYYLGDSWLIDVAPGKENGGGVAENAVGTINHKI